MLIVTKQIDTQKLSTIYDRIYDIADRLFRKYNPCNIHIEDNIVLCAGHSNIQNGKTDQKYGNFLCCNTCKHQSKTGCPIKCLPCKLHLCGWLMYDSKEHKNIKNKLNWLRNIASKHGINTRTYYNTKDEVLDISKKRIERGYQDEIL